MVEENKELEVSTEEQKAEEEATKEVSEDELRTKLADDLGLDPDLDTEILDKVVAREKAHREKLSGAIKQKISWREKAKTTSEKPKDKPEEGGTPKQETPDVDALVDKKLQDKLDARDLEALDLSDELKEEVKKVAKIQGISIREAAKDSYIQSRIEAVKQKEKLEKASPSRSNRGNYVSHVDPSKPLNPEDFDFNTTEGVKAWKEAKAARDTYLKKK